MQIFIGQESGYTILDDCSIVTAPVHARSGSGRRARRDRADPHGLRAGDPDRRHHRQAARLRLEFPRLSRNLRPRSPTPMRCGPPWREYLLPWTRGERPEMSMPNEQDRSAERPISDADYAEGAPAADDLGAPGALAAAEARALESKDLYCGPLPSSRTCASAPARDIEQAHRYALERFANDLHRCEGQPGAGPGQAARRSADALRAGTEATLKHADARRSRRRACSEIDPAGAPFNPELHEAIAVQPSAEPRQTRCCRWCRRAIS